MTDRSPRIATVVLVGAAFLAGVDLFIVNVAFDQIGEDFAGATLADLSWVLTAYAVVYAALLVPMGRLADRVGRRRGFVGGMAVFVLASLACGFAPGIWWLVAFRAVQAAGAAAMTPASLGLLLAALPPERRAPAARLWALTGAVAAALGPALGGGLVQLSWQWAFWINLPVGLLLVAGALRHVPDVRPDERTPLPDLLGALLLVVAVGALVLAVTQGPEWGWSSTGGLATGAVALVAAAGFARRSARHPQPVVDPELLAVPGFRIASLATLVFNVGFAAALLAAILWLQQAWGYAALQTGLAIALGPLAVPVTSVLAHRLLPRAQPAHLIVAGSLVFAASALWQAVALTPTPAYLTQFLPAWILGGVGVGLAMPNLLAAATSALPSAQASTGGGVVTMARQVGLALGVTALVTTLGTAADPEAGFTRAWLAVSLGMVATAVIALRMLTPTGRPTPEPVPVD